MILEHKFVINKSIRTCIENNKNFGRLSCVRYDDDFMIGVIGSKNFCTKIIKEIKVFLKDNLTMALNVRKTKIIHSITEQARFLGYEISCTPRNKMPVGYNSCGRLVRKTTRTILNAPIKKLVEQLRIKSFLNKKNQSTRCSRYINIDLWDILDSYKLIEQGIINYYFMATNYGRLVARVHYSLKYSCVLTICSKMKLKTMRRVFKRYGDNLEIKDGDKSIFYSNISRKNVLENL